MNKVKLHLTRHHFQSLIGLHAHIFFMNAVYTGPGGLRAPDGRNEAVLIRVPTRGPLIERTRSQDLSAGQIEGPNILHPMQQHDFFCESNKTASIEAKNRMANYACFMYKNVMLTYDQEEQSKVTK